MYALPFRAASRKFVAGAARVHPSIGGSRWMYIRATFLSPSPLVGEGWGGGASVSWLSTPTLTLPPQGGGNEVKGHSSTTK
jgi:hypothetical protein